MTVEKSLEESVVEKLIDKKYHIAFAESCTAGMAVARLVNVASASSVLDASFITYANEAKIKYLGVSEESIQAFGVVSEEVAKEMATGVARECNSEVGVGISGIAGPSGGSEAKPVGTVCFGLSINGQVYTWTEHFGNPGRNIVRAKSVDFIYSKLNELL